MFVRMNARQYQHTLENRWSREVRPLFGAREVAGILRAVQRGQGCQAAAEAWSRIAPPDVLAVTAVEAFEKGTLCVAVADPTTRYYLSQQGASLRHRLASVLGGVRALRFELRSGLGTDGAAND